MTAQDFADAVWRKSIRSNGTGNCVELAWTAEAGAVRDSKNPGGPILVFPAQGLTEFIGALPDAATC